MDCFFPWREEWALGLEGIDDQHQRLVAAVNSLLPLYQKLAAHPEGGDTDRERLTGCLLRLYVDLEEHFRDEVNLMREVGFPDWRSHAHAHLMLLAELKNYCERIASQDEKLDPGTLQELKTWFIMHMLDDRALADYVRASRVAGGT